MSDFFQLIEQRESCRNYDPQKRPTKRTAGSLHPGSTALPFRLQLAAVELSGHQFPRKSRCRCRFYPVRRLQQIHRQLPFLYCSL